MRAALGLLVAIAAMAGCASDSAGPDSTIDPTQERTPPGGPFAVSSTAFADTAAIPRRHTCDAENASPPLAFKDAPLEATHLALIMEDPDAPSGTVLHWTFWDLPANVTALSEAEKPGAHGGREGRAYRGPCPPAGSHRYFFHAYATDGPLGLADGTGVEELRAALEGRTLARAQMHGTYMRPNLG